MTDEEKRRGYQAAKELRETSAAFEAVREAFIAQMQSVTNQDGAYRVAMCLQVLEQVRARLMEAAANADLAAHEEEVRQILD